MTKFCESCPMREGAREELTGGFMSAYYEYRVAEILGHGPLIEQYSGRVGSVVDANEGISQPIKVPNLSNDKLSERIIDKIEQCNGPETVEKGLFKKREIAVGCSALRGLQITDSGGVKDQIRQHFQIGML